MKTPTKATLRSAVAWGVLLLVLDWALSCRAQALNSSLSQVPGQRNTALSLYTADGYFYPQLESLLSDPSAIVISSVAELTALSAYNATTATISTSQRRTIVVSATFFSIFRTSTVPLYQQGPNGSQVVPVSFQVEKGKHPAPALVGNPIYMHDFHTHTHIAGHRCKAVAHHCTALCRQPQHARHRSRDASHR